MQDSELVKDLEVKLKEAEAALAHSERRYRHLVEETEGLICTHDLEGNLLSVNPAAKRLLGYAKGEMTGYNLREFLSPRVPAQVFDAFLQRIDAEGADKGTLLLKSKDDRELVFKYHNIKLTEQGNSYVLGHAYDITEIVELQRKLEELTVTDDLTGLYNRRGFLARAEDRINLARRAGEGLIMIVADVDGLKKVNDEHGHSFGSQMIVDTAEILRDSCRQTDVISRWGGDEFVILLGRPGKAGPDVVLRRVQEKIDAFNKTSDRVYTLSVSLGTAPIDASGEVDLAAVFTQADAAMYEAKRRKQ